MLLVVTGMLCICTDEIVFNSSCYYSIYVLIIIQVRIPHNKHKENICTNIIRSKIIQKTQMHNNVYDNRRFDLTLCQTQCFIHFKLKLCIMVYNATKI